MENNCTGQVLDKFIYELSYLLCMVRKGYTNITVLKETQQKLVEMKSGVLKNVKKISDLPPWDKFLVDMMNSYVNYKTEKLNGLDEKNRVAGNNITKMTISKNRMTDDMRKDQIYTATLEENAKLKDEVEKLRGLLMKEW